MFDYTLTIPNVLSREHLPLVRLPAALSDSVLGKR